MLKLLKLSIGNQFNSWKVLFVFHRWVLRNHFVSTFSRQWKGKVQQLCNTSIYSVFKYNIISPFILSSLQPVGKNLGYNVVFNTFFYNSPRFYLWYGNNMIIFCSFLLCFLFRASPPPPPHQCKACVVFHQGVRIVLDNQKWAIIGCTWHNRDSKFKKI